MICTSCGAEVPAPGMFCSANDSLICQGRAPITPCGAVLTADERHWYGATCERCERAWSDRLDVWRAGGVDPELDRMFGAASGTLH